MKCKKCDNALSGSYRFCNQCGVLIDKGACNTEYFSISLKRLALLSFCTLGIYDIYWFYKNWSAVRKIESINISPVGRSCLPILYCYSLFKKVLKSAEAEDYNRTRSPGWLAAVYITCFIASIVSVVVFFDMFLSYSIAAICSIFPLIAVQKAINFHNEKIVGHTNLKKGFSCAEVIIIVIGLALFSLLAYNGGLSSRGMPFSSGSDNNYSKTELINYAVKKIKREMNLPIQLDDSTTLTDVSEESGAMRYHYVLSNVDTSNLTNADFKNILVQNVCKGVKSVLKDGINVEYSYSVKDTGKKYFVSISQSDCDAQN